MFSTMMTKATPLTGRQRPTSPDDEGIPTEFYRDILTGCQRPNQGAGGGQETLPNRRTLRNSS